MIEHIPELVEAGVDSFKIEGRMKTALYVAVVARTYSKALKDYFESPEKYYANMDYYKEEIAKCTYREFTTGFFFGRTDEKSQIYDSNTYVKGSTFLGIISEIDGDYAVFNQKNKFSLGDEINAMDFDGNNIVTKVLEMKNEYGDVESCPHPSEKIWIKTDKKLETGMVLRF